MRTAWGLGWVIATCAASATLQAQTVVRTVERLGSDRPEAWAMHYASAPTLFTGAGAMLAPGAGEWRVGLDLGHVPRLDRAQQRVGFVGTKLEDLNKSPLFGRLHLAFGLPRDGVIALGYTPPLRLDGVRTRDLFALALEQRVAGDERRSLWLRAFAQHGAAEGDITCPAALAGIEDLQRNPFGCAAPSRDRIALNHYGLDATGAWSWGDWRAHATLGALRNEPRVRVDAQVFAVRDRSYLIANDVLPFGAVGVDRLIAPGWRLGAELVHLPLEVRRDATARVERDSFTALRLRLVWRAGSR